MPDFFDYGIADEVHELKGDTPQGNALDDCAQRNCGQHQAIVRAAVQKAHQWRVAASVPTGNHRTATVYHASQPPPATNQEPLRINMKYSLGRDILIN